jgi:hypothetical protein
LDDEKVKETGGNMTTQDWEKEFREQPFFKVLFTWLKTEDIRALESFISRVIDETRKEMINSLTIEEALRWSDKHRALGSGEGVRVLHIKQLLVMLLSPPESPKGENKGEAK